MGEKEREYGLGKGLMKTKEELLSTHFDTDGSVTACIVKVRPHPEGGTDIQLHRNEFLPPADLVQILHAALKLAKKEEKQCRKESAQKGNMS